jgi:hypothetical protein
VSWPRLANPAPLGLAAWVASLVDEADLASAARQIPESTELQDASPPLDGKEQRSLPTRGSSEAV